MKIGRKPARGDKQPARGLGLILAFFVLCFGLVAYRLFDLQTAGFSEFEEYARRMHFSRAEIVPSPRGTIFDRHGHVLAVSVPSYDLYAEPHLLRGDPLETAERLAGVLALPAEHFQPLLSSERRFVFLRRNLNHDEFQRVKELEIPGIGYRENFQRVYPGGRTACHVLGFVQASSQEGLEGVEKHYQETLAGREGRLYRMRDGWGRTLASRYSGEEPGPGRDIYLTLDLAVQRLVEEELARLCRQWSPAGASIVVLDPENGEVLALANYPDYDPNEPGRFPAENRRNRAIADQHEPGSVFKIVTAAALLEEGIVTPQTVVHCEYGRYRVRGRVLSDVHPYGELTFREALIKSSNIGMVKGALELGEEKMHAYAERFGFGRRTGIDLDGERAGFLRPPERWSGTSLTAIPIGYEVSVTALQAARATAAVVNGGVLPGPRILLRTGEEQAEGAEEEKTKAIPARAVNPETAAILAEILTGVTGAEGTARQGYVPGYTVGGKTGTARKIIDGRYTNRYLSSFAGFLVNEKQSLVIVIMVDQPRGHYYGGLVAAPTFRRIGERTMLALGISPEKEDGGEMASALRR